MSDAEIDKRKIVDDLLEEFSKYQYYLENPMGKHDLEIAVTTTVPPWRHAYMSDALLRPGWSH